MNDFSPRHGDYGHVCWDGCEVWRADGCDGGGKLLLGGRTVECPGCHECKPPEVAPECTCGFVLAHSYECPAFKETF